MYGIGVSAVTYDLSGAHYFRGCELDGVAAAKNRQGARRLTKTATLDGGCVVYDTGYAPSDRNIIISVIRPAENVVSLMAYLVATYNQIVVSTAESVFVAVPERYYIEDNGSAVMVLSVVEQIGG